MLQKERKEKKIVGLVYGTSACLAGLAGSCFGFFEYQSSHSINYGLNAGRALGIGGVYSSIALIGAKISGAASEDKISCSGLLGIFSTAFFAAKTLEQLLLLTSN